MSSPFNRMLDKMNRNKAIKNRSKELTIIPSIRSEINSKISDFDAKSIIKFGASRK